MTSIARAHVGWVVCVSGFSSSTLRYYPSYHSLMGQVVSPLYRRGNCLTRTFSSGGGKLEVLLEGVVGSIWRVEEIFDWHLFWVISNSSQLLLLPSSQRLGKGVVGAGWGAAFHCPSPRDVTLGCFEGSQDLESSLHLLYPLWATRGQNFCTPCPPSQLGNSSSSTQPHQTHRLFKKQLLILSNVPLNKACPSK